MGERQAGGQAQGQAGVVLAEGLTDWTRWCNGAMVVVCLSGVAQLQYMGIDNM